MIQIRLLLLGLTVIGTIGYAVYNHYINQEQPQAYGSRRRRRSSNGGGDDDDDDASSYRGSFGSVGQRKRNIEKSDEFNRVKEPCTICLRPVYGIYKTLSCGHAFHNACIQCWFDKSKTTCPNCRAEVL